MADIRVICPCCGVSLRAKPQLAGQTIRCPQCVSLVPIKAPEDDFAEPVEANYEAVPLEENNVGRVCPKCGASIRPGGKLCKQCGWHLQLETYFEDLKDENLIVREEPKTKWEAWFERQLHESARPRDVLNFSAIGGVVATIIFLAVAHFRMGVWMVLTLPLIIVLWVVWYRYMQLIGLLPDPTRNRILEKEKAERAAKVAAPSPAPMVSPSAPVTQVQASGPAAGSKVQSPSSLAFELPEAEISGQAKPTSPPRTAAAKPSATQSEKKVVRPPAGGRPATTAAGPAKPKPAPPAKPKPGAESPTKPKAADDDWLNDLL